MVGNCFRSAIQLATSLAASSKIGKDVANLPWKFPLEFDSLDPVEGNTVTNASKNSFYFKKQNVSDTYCPIDFSSTNINQLLNNRILQKINIQNNGQRSSANLNVWFEKRTGDQPSVFSSQFLELFVSVNFDGEVYYPPGEGLSAPNGGFQANEDAFTIWGEISNKRSKAMIYWLFPGLMQSLAGTCPVTCVSTC